MRLVGRNLQRLVEMETQRRLLIIHQQINPQIRIETKSIAVKHYLQQDAVTDLNIVQKVRNFHNLPGYRLVCDCKPGGGRNGRKLLYYPFAINLLAMAITSSAASEVG